LQFSANFYEAQSRCPGQTFKARMASYSLSHGVGNRPNKIDAGERNETMMKRILLGVFSLAMVLGTASTSQAQYHHRHCWYQHHHRVCRAR
jgi:hypothetical protein